MEEGKVVWSDRLGRYRLGRRIGEGGFGVVHEADRDDRDDPEGPPRVAVKGIPLSRLRADGKLRRRMADEIRLQRLAKHPNLVRLLDAFQDKERAYLVTELCPGGDLHRMIERHQRLSEDEARKVVRQLADALKYLHERDIMHRDVKPANIFIASDGSYKLGDFGLATGPPDEAAFRQAPSLSRPHQTMCGTPSSISPEMAGEIAYSAQVDVWGIGVVLYWMLEGKPPFEDPRGDTRKMLEKIKSIQHNRFSKGHSKDALHLLNGLFQPEADRFTLHDVLTHSFLSEGRHLSGQDSGIGTTATMTTTSSLHYNSTSRENYGGISQHTYGQSHRNQRIQPEIRRPMSETDVRSRAGGLPRQRSLTPLSEASVSPSSLLGGGLGLGRQPLVVQRRPRSGSVDRIQEWLPRAESTAVTAAAGPPSTPSPRLLQPVVAPRLSTRLNTQRLRPTKRPQHIRTGVSGEITAGGEVRFEFRITKRSGVALREVVTVGGDGHRVCVERMSEDGSEWLSSSVHKYSDLPHNLHQKYNIMAKYVQCLREKTPKVTMHCADSTCHLMENEPGANFEARFHDSGLRMSYSPAREQTICEYEGGGERKVLDGPIESLAEGAERYGPLDRFARLYQECKATAKDLERREMSAKFPVVFGKKTSRGDANGAPAGPTSKRRSPSTSVSSALQMIPRASSSSVLSHAASSASSVRSWESLRRGVELFTFSDGTSLEMDLLGCGGKLESSRYLYYDGSAAPLEGTVSEVDRQSQDIRDKVVEAFKKMKERATTAKQ